jgi:hypothetical protein
MGRHRLNRDTTQHSNYLGGPSYPQLMVGRLGQRNTVLVLVGLSQLVTFQTKIGLTELSWRPVVFIAEVALTSLAIRFAFKAQKRWPLILLVVWHVVVAVLIWQSGMILWRSDVGNPPGLQFWAGPGQSWEGPDFTNRNGARLMLVGAVVLAAVVPRSCKDRPGSKNHSS